MYFCGKKTTVSCRIKFSERTRLIEWSDFQTLVLNGRTFCAAQSFNQFNFDVANAHVPFTAHVMYVITKDEKSQSVTQ